jgi:hypothetical protein
MKALLFIAAILMSLGVMAQPNIPAKFFISDAFAASKGLKPVKNDGGSKTWKGKMKNVTTTVKDSRWKFNSFDEAAQHLQLNMPLLSETGDQEMGNIKITGASNLFVYNEGAGNRSYNEATGVKSFSYIFLFTVKNYVAKVNVITNEKITVNDAAVFAKEAAKRLNAALK